MKRVYAPVVVACCVGACLRAREDAPSAAPEQQNALERLAKSELSRDEAEEDRGGAPKRKARAMKVAAALAPAAAAVGGAGLVMEEPPAERDDNAKGEGGEGEAEAPSARSYFPETFLFEPRVVTDEAGQASYAVRVPDRLTTWRVLALAHSRSGGQAGAEAHFLGTLPAYVDPVLPPFLYAGDELLLPIQVVNTTDLELSRPLRISASGAASARGAGTVNVPAQGSRVEYAPIKASKPGLVTLKVSFGDQDAVERGFSVRSLGRPMVGERGGSLAAPREVTLDLPAELEPDGASLAISVYPGALALLRSELALSPQRGGLAEDAYALLLLGKAPALLGSLGETIDAGKLRPHVLVLQQRVLRAARAPSVGSATILLAAAAAHPDNPVLSRLAERLAGTLASGQRPDGSFQGADGWTLSRLLVATADALEALAAARVSPEGQRRAEAAKLRASGAFERHLGRVEDVYTTAAILAARGVEGSAAEGLAKRLRDAVVKQEDGSATLPVPAEAQRADGSRPSELELVALAVLALASDAEGQKLLPDLGARLLAGYRPGWGWGDGRTNLVALRAALQLFKDPLPAEVRVQVSLDGRPVGETKLSGARLKEVAVIEAPLPAVPGSHRLELRAEPPVPGLGYAASWRYFVPWRLEGQSAGFELSVEAPVKPRVGQPVDVAVAAAAPAGVAAVLEQALPAGVQVDRPSLDRLVGAGTLARYEATDGLLTLYLPPRGPGQSFAASVRLIPTLAGTLHAAASRVFPEGRPELAFHLPPVKWEIR